MWTSLATNLVSAVASHYLDGKSTTNNTQKGNSGPDNYNITGYINDVPVDLRVEKSSSSSTRPKANLRSAQPNETSIRSLNVQQQHSGCVSTCQNSSTCKPSQKKNLNYGNDNICRISLPSKGNYDIRIRKTDSNFAGMKISDNRPFKSNETQNKQNGNQNKQIQNQNKPNRNVNKQNGNSNNCTGNQNRQNGNYNNQTGNQNKQNGNNNNQTGNQKKPNGNCNNQNGNQNKQNGNNNNQTGNQKKLNGNNNNQNGNQNKPNGNYNNQSKQQIKDRKPGELKLGNGNNGNRQVNGCQSTWMYVGRLRQGTSEADLRIYLQAKFRGHNFIVESLPLYKKAKLPCFKVRVDNTILAEFKNADSWPIGVTVTEFIENFKS